MELQFLSTSFALVVCDTESHLSLDAKNVLGRIMMRAVTSFFLLLAAIPGGRGGAELGGPAASRQVAGPGDPPRCSHLDRRGDGRMAACPGPGCPEEGTAAQTAPHARGQRTMGEGGRQGATLWGDVQM